MDNEVFWRTEGHAVPVEYTSTPIRRDGKLNGAVIIFRDISARKQIERQQVGTLKRHRWPGNIRELKNVIERAVILSRSERLRLDLALPSELGAEPALDVIPADKSEFLTDAEFREREKTNMIAALRYSNWRIWGPNGAAELLGLKPSTLTYRMKVFGIQKIHRTG